MYFQWVIASTSVLERERENSSISRRNLTLSCRVALAVSSKSSCFGVYPSACKHWFVCAIGGCCTRQWLLHAKVTIGGGYVETEEVRKRGKERGREGGNEGCACSYIRSGFRCWRARPSSSSAAFDRSVRFSSLPSASVLSPVNVFLPVFVPLYFSPVNPSFCLSACFHRMICASVSESLCVRPESDASPASSRGREFSGVGR